MAKKGKKASNKVKTPSTKGGSVTNVNGKGKGKGKGHVQTPKCYLTHPVLKSGGGKLVGGACGSPIVTDADVYVGFDYSMWHHPDSYPWSENKVVCIHMPVTDYMAPKDPKLFIAMVEWVVGRLAEGKTVHMGCMAGHGRTGVGLAAVVSVADGNKDAIRWVRENYCDRAVESHDQVDFLSEHFGIKKAPVSKPSYAGMGGYYGYNDYSKYASKTTTSVAAAEVFSPVESALFLFGDNVSEEW